MTDDLRKEVVYDRNLWRSWYSFFSVAHYVFGIAGVIAGVFAASGFLKGGGQEIAGLAAAIASAILGFLKPEKLSEKYAAAFTLLDDAIVAFDSDHDKEKLVKAHLEGTKLITGK